MKGVQTVPQTMNPYSYSGNNPLAYTDADGRFREPAKTAKRAAKGAGRLICRSPAGLLVCGSAVVASGDQARDPETGRPLDPGPEPDPMQDTGTCEYVACVDNKPPVPPVTASDSSGDNAGGASTIGEQIASGHAFDKHVLVKGEFQGLETRTRKQFADFIDNIANSAKGQDYKSLTNQREAYWDFSTGTVVIYNPRVIDGGTAFRRPDGKRYFDGLK